MSSSFSVFFFLQKKIKWNLEAKRPWSLSRRTMLAADRPRVRCRARSRPCALATLGVNSDDASPDQGVEALDGRPRRAAGRLARERSPGSRYVFCSLHSLIDARQARLRDKGSLRLDDPTIVAPAPGSEPLPSPQAGRNSHPGEMEGKETERDTLPCERQRSWPKSTGGRQRPGRSFGCASCRSSRSTGLAARVSSSYTRPS